MSNISVLYHHFPHYRAPVLRALASSTRNRYSFFGSIQDFDGIVAFKGDDQVSIRPIDFIAKERGGMNIQNFTDAISSEFDACIIIGNINIPGTWLANWRARRNGLKTAFWSHGWLRQESYHKSLVRNFYFRQADRVLVYGSRAKHLAAASGFPADRVRVIWNSLDWSRQSSIYQEFSLRSRDDLRQELGMPRHSPVLLTISRVTDLCHYDWLIEAVAGLRSASSLLGEIWMIGDGPSLPNLIDYASRLGVKLVTKGAQYDEFLIAKHIMAADVVVSPGKIGLTAMHSLAYGTPVVTHGNLDLQMPEVEAIVEGKSGEFFTFGDVHGLQDAISLVLSSNTELATRRQNCRDSLIGRFTPLDQARLIDDAMDELLKGVVSV